MNAPGISVTGTEVQANADGTTSVAVGVTCDADYDLFTVTPQVTVEGEERYLPPVGLGYLNLSDEDVERIADR